MDKAAEQLKTTLANEIKEIASKCPDEIKRFHYGLITHSQAGKFALNQYFGHWVHSYCVYFIYLMDIFPYISKLAADPNFNLNQVKQVFRDISQTEDLFLLTEYSGQKTLGIYLDKMVKVLDVIDTKEEFSELLDVFRAYLSRRYCWFHYYFPWGLGPSAFQRIEPEDVKEMMRLSQISNL